MNAPKLSAFEVRTDLTDRELVKIIGGLLGSLGLMADLSDLRNAVRWWAASDDAWAMLKGQRKTMDDAIQKARKSEGWI